MRRYLHDSIDIGLGVVNIVHPLLEDNDWPDQTAARNMLDRLNDAARHNKTVPADVTAIDITLAAIRFCRPLAIGLEPAEERAIAHQQLDCYLDGLTYLERVRRVGRDKWPSHRGSP